MRPKPTITVEDLVGYIVVGVSDVAGRPALVIRQPWPFLPFGVDPAKAIADCARRWTVEVTSDGHMVVEEIDEDADALALRAMTFDAESTP